MAEDWGGERVEVVLTLTPEEPRGSGNEWVLK